MNWLRRIENRLIYFPCRYPRGDWNPAGLDLDEVWLRTDDGVRLHGWFCRCQPVTRRPDDDGRVLLYCHGNAGNVTTRADIIRAWQRHFGLDVLIFDYRGYGKSEGRPDEGGLYRDSRSAYAWLTQTRGLPPESVVLLGRSLGGAVAMELALAVPHRSLILESTFTSLPNLAATLYPWFPVRYLMRSQFDVYRRISQYRRPVLIIHGSADELVPCSQAVELFRLAAEPKRLVIIAGGGHDDLIGSGGGEYVRAVADFLA